MATVSVVLEPGDIRTRPVSNARDWKFAIEMGISVIYLSQKDLNDLFISKRFKRSFVALRSTLRSQKDET